MESLQSREIKSTSTVIESHFTHPNHPLHLTDIDKDFECDACNGPGQGRRYRCSACTFDLHERCATCPSTLSCAFHPSHLLTLVLDHDAHRPCTLCGRSVSGLHYTCSRGSTDGCVFNIHPLCTELPRDFSSARKVPVVSCPVVNVQPPPQPTVMYYQNGCLYMAQPAAVTHPCTAYNNSYTSSQQPLVISNSNYYHTRGQTGNYNNGSDYCQPQHQQESSEDLSAYEDYMAGDMENDGSGGGDSSSYSTARGSESTVAASYPTASSNRPFPPLPLLGLLSSLNPKLGSHNYYTCQTSAPSSGSFHRHLRSSSPDKFPPALRSCCHCRMTISKCLSAAAPDPVSVPSPPEQEVPDPEPDFPALVVVSFYKFADFPDHADLRAPLKNLCEELRVSGGIILAPEGINGSICGTRESVEKVLGFIQSDDRLNGLRQIESPVSPEEEALHHGHSSSSPLAAGEDAPFRWDHVRVKLKKEIVSLGMPSVSPIERVGTYVSPRDWNALISDPDTVVIDVRNIYETRIGKFKGAVDPCTAAFREFPSWVDNQFQLPEPSRELSTEDDKSSNDKKDPVVELSNERMPQRVAMYCTGGIRCEKASSFLLTKGFKEVYHLKGGILKYLEEIPETESMWEGECFVFDKRVSVEHGLAPGTFKLCYGCKQPVSDEDMEAPEWEYGVTCPYCYSSKSQEEKERARARQRQFETWGIIGGPDKGRRPAVKPDATAETIISAGTNIHQSSSV